MDRVKDVDSLTRQYLPFPENGRTQIQANSAANFTPPPTLPLFEPLLKDRNRGLGLFDGPRAIRSKQQIHLIVDPPTGASYIPNPQSNSPFTDASQFVTPHPQIESHRVSYNQSAFERHSQAVASNIQHPRNNSPFLRRAQVAPQTQNIKTNETNCNQRALKKAEIKPCNSDYSNKMHPMMHMGSTAPAKSHAAPAAKKTPAPLTPLPQARNHAVDKKKSGHVSEMPFRFNCNMPPSAGTPAKKVSVSSSFLLHSNLQIHL